MRSFAHLVILGVITLVQQLHAQDDRYLPIHHGELVRHEHYVLSYLEEYEHAEWVSWELLSEELNGQSKRSSSFYEDTLVQTKSASPNDYKGSGYDRGHLAPAADFSFSQRAMRESFFMSNMSPQWPGLNRGVWKDIEEECRSLARIHGSVYQIAGPVFTTDSISRLPSGIAVPEGYFRLVIYPSSQPIDTLVYLVPNKLVKGEPKDFVLPSTFEWYYVEKLWGIKEEKKEQ